MRRLLALCLLVALPASAGAEPYDELAAKAGRVVSAAHLDELFWAATATCNEPGDLARRQCEAVRADRARAVGGASFLISGDAAAVIVGDLPEGKPIVTLGLRGCIACETAIAHGAEKVYVTGPGAARLEGGALRAADVWRGEKSFTDAPHAVAFHTKAATRLRSEFIIRVPERATPWTQGGARGFTVDIIGYRLWDPCDGAVLASNPAAGPGPVDKKTCNKVIDRTPETQPVKVVDKTPDKLSSDVIRESMQPAVAEVEACFDTYGVPGKANLVVTIGGDGVVKKVVLTGDFEDTPTGECIVQTVQKIEFPKFKRAEMSFKWPFVLR